MNKINVLVTGAGGGGIGEQVIKCLRFSELKCHVVATDINEVTKAKIDADEFVLAPLATSPDFVNFILTLCINKNIKVIVPGSEVELKVFSKNRSLFEEKGIALLVNSENVIDICLDKNRTAEFLTKNGFYSPASVSIASLNDLNKVTGFPQVLKPSVGGGGSINTMIVQNSDELRVFGQFLLNQYKEFIAQEYVGDPLSEFTVGVLSTAEGTIVDSIVLKRNILSGLGSKLKILNTTGKTELGKYLVISSGISQGEIVKNQLVSGVAEKIATTINSTGPLNIQCRVQDGKVYIFEINPRFSGTSPMRALAGFNEVEISIKNKLFSEKFFSRINYKTGHVVRGLVEYFVK